jgi:O-antigen/teichoic acid export membrane protein
MAPILKKNIFPPNLNHLKGIKKQLLAAKPFFLTKLSISAYTTANPLILNMFASTAEVGAFALAEKIVMAAKHATSPIANIFFPKLARLFSENKPLYINELKNCLKIMLLGGAFLSSICFFMAEKITLLINNIPLHSIDIIRMMSLVPLLAAISNVYSLQVMTIHKKEKIISVIIFSISITSIILSLLLTNQYKAIGLASSILITELLTATVFMFFGIKLIKSINTYT